MPPAPRLCLWGLESGAVGAAGPRGSQADSARGRAVVEARLQAHLMEPLRDSAAPKARDRGAYVWASGCKFYQRACSEPRPPSRRRRGRGRLHQKRSLICGEDQQKAGTRR